MASGGLLFVLLAALGAADVPSPETSGRPGSLEPLFPALESPRGGPDEGAYFPVTVWKFVEGKKSSTALVLVAPR